MRPKRGGVGTKAVSGLVIIMVVAIVYYATISRTPSVPLSSTSTATSTATTTSLIGTSTTIAMSTTTATQTSTVTSAFTTTVAATTTTQTATVTGTSTTSSTTSTSFQNTIAKCTDLSDPGIPSVKTAWRQGLALDDLPSDYFDYDPGQYLVYTQNIHATEIVVAIHKSLVGISDIQGFGVPSPKEFADFVFKVFHQYWHVFGGFVYDRYTVKVNSMNDSQTFKGAASVGLIVGRISSAIPNYPPHQYVTAMVWEFVSHELFHAWNGKIIKFHPSGDGRLFQLETWIMEGSTFYYSPWVMGIVLGPQAYESAIKYRWNQYQGMVGTQFDLSIEELTFKIGTPTTLPPPPSNYSIMLFARSMLLNYMLDTNLSKFGISLDALMRYLYVNYGLTGKQWSQADIPPALNLLSGQRFEDFFNSYLYKNTRLPLDGNFLLISHPESRLTPCTP